MRRSNLLPLFIALSATALPSTALAASPWRLDVTAGTDFPLSVGARLTVEGPGRLLLSTGLGVLPGAYVDAVNGALIGFGAYDDRTADLVDSALRGALVWRTHVGWRPFAKAGFYVQAGYAAVALGGGISAVETISLATGRPIPPQAIGDLRARTEADLHMIDAEMGWTWSPWRNLVIRAALGGAFTVSSSSRITVSGPPQQVQAVTPLVEEGEAYLDDTLRSYVHTPVASVLIGWRFR